MLSVVFATFLFNFLTEPAATAELWHSVESPHLYLESFGPADQARKTVWDLEELNRSIDSIQIIQGLHSIRAQQSKLRIYAFNSRERSERAGTSRGSFGSYIHRANADLVLLEDVRPEHKQAALHEFAHHLIIRSGLVLPLWANEGVADLLSSLEIRQSVIRIGGTLESRLDVLRGQRLIPLRELLTTTARSSRYTGATDTHMFYAQSWALVHMLLVEESYKSCSERLFQALAQGQELGELLPQFLHKDLGDLEADHIRYVALLLHDRASILQFSQSVPISVMSVTEVDKLVEGGEPRNLLN